MTVKNTEGLSRAGLTRPVELGTLGGTMILPKPQKLISDEKVREYQGKFVALTSTGPKDIIASADDYGSLTTAVKKLNISDYLIIPVPRMGVAYSH